MVLLGKVWAAAMPAASDAAASAVQHTRFNMVFSSVRPSDPPQPQLPGKPVIRPASIAISAVVGTMPTVLVDPPIHPSPYALPSTLRMLEQHPAMLTAADDLNPTSAG